MLLCFKKLNMWLISSDNTPLAIFSSLDETLHAISDQFVYTPNLTIYQLVDPLSVQVVNRKVFIQ